MTTRHIVIRLVPALAFAVETENETAGGWFWAAPTMIGSIRFSVIVCGATRSPARKDC